MATEGILGAMTQPPPQNGSIPPLLDAVVSSGHLDGSANGDTLIRCVWSNAPYPWADDVQGIFWRLVQPFAPYGVHKVVCRCRKELEMQEALGKEVQPLWMDPGAMGAVPTSVMGCACGQGTR